MKQQIIFIHGGDAHSTYEEYIESLKHEEIDPYSEAFSPEPKRWKDTFTQKLGPSFDVLFPEMPSWMNAKYTEWKIWFERLPQFIDGPVILIGHSLGAIFLAKYLSENIFVKKIKAVFLLAGPYRTVSSKEKIGDFVLPDNLSKMQEQSEQIFIYQSKDDPMVDVSEAQEYAKALPKAHLVLFEDKGHFRQQEFPELVEQIIKITK